MSIDSCDHGDFIVVYEVTSRLISCPVCTMESDIADYEAEIKDLKEN